MHTLYKLFLTLTLLHLHLSAKEIKPAFVMKSKGLVNDFVLDGALLYVGNSEGSVEVFDIQQRKKVDEIFIEPMKTLNDDWVNVKILSVDRYNGKTLIVSTAKDGYRNIWIDDGKKLKLLIGVDKKSSVKEARFVNDSDFVYGTLGYDIARYTQNDTYNLYKNQIEESTFSDMVLSEDKKSFVTASESGQVTIMDVKTGKILKQPKPLNLDNIYKLDYKNGTIITAGQDRRVGVYPKSGTPYYIKSNFLVYCVGLSPSGNIGVYSANDENHLQLFNVKTGKKTDTLIGQDSVPSTIKFFNEDGFFSAGYGYTIYYWYLKDLNSTK